MASPSALTSSLLTAHILPEKSSLSAKPFSNLAELGTATRVSILSFICSFSPEELADCNINREYPEASPIIFVISSIVLVSPMLLTTKERTAPHAESSGCDQQRTIDSPTSIDEGEKVFLPSKSSTASSGVGA